jgi:tetratricopeptide (TPR) repeat protein
MNEYSFGSSQKLLMRLKSSVSKGKKITIICGSGLTLGNKTYPGVSSTSEIVDSIINKLGADRAIIDEELKDASNPGERYQKAMKTLLECEGQDELNVVIQMAVLKARLDKKSVISKGDIDLETLERDYDNWILNPALEALARLYSQHRRYFSDTILTTNFDPLIEIALNKSKVQTETKILSTDGKIENSVRHSDMTSVVHLHGFWRGSDTLHTAKQITRNRPQLKGSLSAILSTSLILVIGYSGWDDVFTKALVDLINEENSKVNVLWCFYGDEDLTLAKQNISLLKKIDASLEQRVVLYKGVDCMSLFPELLKILNQEKSADENNLVVKKYEDNIVLPALTSEFNALMHTGVGKVFASDNPIVNHKWTGREKELASINDSSKNVVYISGIGGQGKSGIASEYLSRYVTEDSEWEFWDWRDCKEESNRIYTKLIFIIERLTEGRYRAYQFTNSKFEDIVDLFFKVLGSRKIVFVFDNVDYYVDIVSLTLNGNIGFLFDEALLRQHNSKFIFTGRPVIENLKLNFLSLKLSGLSVDEARALFMIHPLPIKATDIEELATRSTQLTNGHPLWLNLIIGQGYKGKDNINDFLNDIGSSNGFNSSSQSDILAVETLDAIWSRLNVRQQTLLKILAENTKSETMDNLYQISEGEMTNYNKFHSAMNHLNNINLVVTKSQRFEKDEFELHPLVKQLIRRKYFQREDRRKYISLLVNFYDRVITVLKPKLDHEAPFSYFEKFTAKIELLINDLDYESALTGIREIFQPINLAGYTEEYLRVSHLLFISIDWEKAIIEEYNYFHDEFYAYAITLIEFGRHEEAKNYLKKYTKSISGKGVNYIRYCKMESYLAWFTGDYISAINYAEEGLHLLKESNIDTSIELDHQLALALRDSAIAENIDRAITIFRMNEALAEICDEDTIKNDLGGTFYGNIGRCYQILGSFKKALNCYKKSVVLLESSTISSTLLNKGYAFSWIGEIYSSNNEIIKALYAFALSKCYWDTSSPIKSTVIQAKINQILLKAQDINLHKILDTTRFDLEKMNRRFLEGNS